MYPVQGRAARPPPLRKPRSQSSQLCLPRPHSHSPGGPPRLTCAREHLHLVGLPQPHRHVLQHTGDVITGSVQAVMLHIPTETRGQGREPGQDTPQSRRHAPSHLAVTTCPKPPSGCIVHPSPEQAHDLQTAAHGQERAPASAAPAPPGPEQVGLAHLQPPEQHRMTEHPPRPRTAGGSRTLPVPCVAGPGPDGRGPAPGRTRPTPRAEGDQPCLSRSPSAGSCTHTPAGSLQPGPPDRQGRCCYPPPGVPGRAGTATWRVRPGPAPRGPRGAWVGVWEPQGQGRQWPQGALSWQGGLPLGQLPTHTQPRLRKLQKRCRAAEARAHSRPQTSKPWRMWTGPRHRPRGT